MNHVMFDIDGTLVESYDLDSKLFSESVYEVTGTSINTDWSRYRNVTDSGIVQEFFEENSISRREDTEKEIKKVLVEKLKRTIEVQPIQEVSGAKEFLSHLRSMSDVVISIATGGWHESAILKLSSAGIDTTSIPIASSNDHVSRLEIMKLAALKATAGKAYSCTYFGDGAWDKKACEQLGFNFVLVGNKTKHGQNIGSFQSLNEALTYVGL